MEDGSIENDLGPGKPCNMWMMADEPVSAIDLPVESRLMLELVGRGPRPQIAAAFDLRQDITEGLPAGAYHYAFGDLGRYAAIVGRIAA